MINRKSLHYDRVAVAVEGLFRWRAVVLDGGEPRSWSSRRQQLRGRHRRRLIGWLRESSSRCSHGLAGGGGGRARAPLPRFLAAWPARRQFRVPGDTARPPSPAAAPRRRLLPTPLPPLSCAPTGINHSARRPRRLHRLEQRSACSTSGRLAVAHVVGTAAPVRRRRPAGSSGGLPSRRSVLGRHGADDARNSRQLFPCVNTSR